MALYVRILWVLLMTGFVCSVKNSTEVRVCIKERIISCNLGIKCCHQHNKDSDYCTGRFYNGSGCVPGNTCTLIRNAFERFGHVVNLNISNCRIASIENHALNGLFQLRTLDLSHNLLKSIPTKVLTSIPQLVHLFLRGNPIGHFFTGTFQPLVQLNLLDVADTSLSSLEIELFNKSHQLETLDVSHNRYLGNISNITHAIMKGYLPSLHKLLANNASVKGFLLEPTCLSNLRHLELSSNKLQFFRKTFRCAPQCIKKVSKLRKLVVDNNYQETMNFAGDVFCDMRELTSLSLRNCNLAAIGKRDLYGLTELTHLDTSENPYYQMPKVIQGSKSLVPKIIAWQSVNGKLSPTERLNFTGLESIQRMNLSGNFLKILPPHAFANLQMLWSLDLSDNTISTIDDQAFSGLAQLTHLNMMDSNHHFVDENQGIFKPLQNLEVLTLTNNHFVYMHTHAITKMFQPLCSLHELHIEKVQLRSISSGWFTCMRNLTTLHLSSNYLTTWDHSLLEGLPILSLAIANNQIQTVSQAMLEPITYTIAHFEGQGNPYYCGCEIKWYISWLKMQPGIDRQGYKCWNHKQKVRMNLFSYSPSILHCYPIVELTSAGIAFLLLVALAVVLYKKRHYIRFWFYLSNIRKKKYLEEKELHDNEKFQYDVFISYSPDDQDWVRKCVKKLEENNDLKCCINPRNFDFGSSVPESIVNSIEESRKTALVLSHSYIQNGWCRFELEMAQSRQVKDSKDFLLLIMLKPLESREMKPALHYLVKYKNYLKWPQPQEGPAAEEQFWATLKKSLSGPTDHIIGML